MHLRAALLLSVTLFFLACSLAEGLAGGDYRKVGDHWFNPSDRGYFKIFNIRGEELFMFSEPALGSKIVMPLTDGLIVASDGISHWGGAASWRRIAFGTADGWIPERQLIRARPRTLGSTEIPVAGSCIGYDPVWSVSWKDTTLRLSLFPGREQINIAYSTASAQSKTWLLTGNSANLSADLIMTSQACAPVQGRYLFGMSGSLVVTEVGGKRLLSGCCQADVAAF